MLSNYAICSKQKPTKEAMFVFLCLCIFCIFMFCVFVFLYFVVSANSVFVYACRSRTHIYACSAVHISVVTHGSSYNKAYPRKSTPHVFTQVDETDFDVGFIDRLIHLGQAHDYLWGPPPPPTTD